MHDACDAFGEKLQVPGKCFVLLLLYFSIPYLSYVQLYIVFLLFWAGRAAVCSIKRPLKLGKNVHQLLAVMDS